MSQPLVVTEAFVGRLPSEPEGLFRGYRGQLVDSDHAAVKKWPGFFAVPESVPAATPVVPRAARR
jgi:hypothetical protein